MVRWFFRSKVTIDKININQLNQSMSMFVKMAMAALFISRNGKVYKHTERERAI